jgi:hypothetical protein
MKFLLQVQRGSKNYDAVYEILKRKCAATWKGGVSRLMFMCTPVLVSVNRTHPAPYQTISFRFILILSSHKCLGLQSGFFPSGFLS